MDPILGITSSVDNNYPLREKSNNLSINSLPVEIFQKIILYLTNDLNMQFMLVNHHWNSITKEVAKQEKLALLKEFAKVFNNEKINPSIIEEINNFIKEIDVYSSISIKDFAEKIKNAMLEKLKPISSKDLEKLRLECYSDEYKDTERTKFKDRVNKLNFNKENCANLMKMLELLNSEKPKTACIYKRDPIFPYTILNLAITNKRIDKLREKLNKKGQTLDYMPAGERLVKRVKELAINGDIDFAIEISK